MNNFESYIRTCWRSGWKLSKIVDNWEGDVSEKDCLDMFKYVVSKQFGIGDGYVFK